MQLRFLSTLSLRRATCYIIFAQAVTNISIHALLAESDNVACGYWHKLRNFYPRSPCGERPTPRCRPLSRAPFLSTLSLRRATVQNYNACVGARISIHALLAESDPLPAMCTNTRLTISIHALLAESDFAFSGRPDSALPISIHALLAESDAFWCWVRLRLFPISIHALLAESDGSAFLND